MFHADLSLLLDTPATRHVLRRVLAGGHLLGRRPAEARLLLRHKYVSPYHVLFCLVGRASVSSLTSDTDDNDESRQWQDEHLQDSTVSAQSCLNSRLRILTRRGS